MLIKKGENAGLDHLNDSYKSMEGYNPNRKRKILNVFDDKIADMLTNK